MPPNQGEICDNDFRRGFATNRHGLQWSLSESLRYQYLNSVFMLFLHNGMLRFGSSSGPYFVQTMLRVVQGSLNSYVVLSHAVVSKIKICVDPSSRTDGHRLDGVETLQFSFFNL